MAEFTAAPGGMQVVTPAPRPLWRRLLDTDTDALADHGPEWIDAVCDGGRYVDANSEPASVIILPVVRIERHPDEPTNGLSGGDSTTPGRRRRRRNSR